MLLPGDQIHETDERGRRIIGETLLLLLNAHHEPLPFKLPVHTKGKWEVFFDTAMMARAGQPLAGESVYDLRDRSVVAFRYRSDQSPQKSSAS
jgi:glycogen operon protein